jgi:signal peptidase I
MGDNRDFSNDSRFWGFVPMYYVKGRAMFVWLSVQISFSDNEYRFRTDRIGTMLH